MVALGRARHMMWAAASAVLADRFFQNAWRDWKHMRSRSSESTLNARLLINAFVALYNVFAFCVDLCSDRSNYNEPSLSFRLLVSTTRVLNFAISITMLHLYMHLCECWTEQCLVSGRQKKFFTALLIIFILIWSLLDRGRSWYDEVLWWSLHPQWDSKILPGLLPGLSICYYAISTFVDMGCCCVLWYMQYFYKCQVNTPDGERSHSRNLSLLSDLGASFNEGSVVSVSAVHRNTIQPVLNANIAVTFVTVMMTLFQFLRLDDEAFRKWYNYYGDLMFVLYTTRYALFYILARPTNRPQENTSTARLAHDVNDALHCAPESYWRTYQFRRGKAMVICNSLYHESTGLEVLPDGGGGATIAFGEVFCQLGFEPSCNSNLIGEDIRMRFKNFVSEAATDDVDGIALAYLGHGDVDTIIGVDGVPVNISEILDMIMSEPVLQQRPKPKLLIFDCCRGPGVELMTRSQVTRKSFPPRLGFLHSRPSLYSDFLLCYATANGFAAFNQERGGLFSQTLVQHINKFFAPDQPAGSNSLDIVGLMTEVIGSVCEKRNGYLCKQAPEIRSSLTRKFKVAAATRPRAFSDPC